MSEADARVLGEFVDRLVCCVHQPIFSNRTSNILVASHLRSI
jgi:hypothetical protein